MVVLRIFPLSLVFQNFRMTCLWIDLFIQCSRYMRTVSGCNLVFFGPGNFSYAISWIIFFPVFSSVFPSRWILDHLDWSSYSVKGFFPSCFLSPCLPVILFRFPQHCHPHLCWILFYLSYFFHFPELFHVLWLFVLYWIISWCRVLT